MEQKAPNFIEKTPFEEPSEDFDLLVSRGIDLLQKLTGTTWTDYNYHDPGVTILEQLCFAFTDLSYRTGFDIKDILCDEKGEICRIKNSFFNKKKILTTNAVTVNDYRKVILDEVEEVDNVDVVPVLSKFSSSFIRGLYELRVKLKDHLAEEQKNDPKFNDKIENKIRKAFISKRNLGEDLCRKMVILTPHTITIHAEIIVKEFTHPEEVLLNIFRKIQEFLSPQLRFYSERELLETNARIEEVYEGPLLKHGIVPDSELRPMKSEIDVFKLIGAVSSAKDVLLVQNLVVNGQTGRDLGHSFLLDKNSFPVINPVDFLDSIKLYTGDYKLHVSKKNFLDLLGKSNSLNRVERSASRHTKDGKYIAGGKYKNPGEYTSIQENFPHIYGLGKFGVYSHEGADRKANVKQLRAYIFFFEQVLANYLAQLENISNLFSTDIEGEGSRSFYYKPLYEIRGANEILGGTRDKDKWEAFIRNENNPYMFCLQNEQESVSDYRRRKHKTFEHLYARFNEIFTNYPVNAYINSYGDIKDSKSGLLLKWKANILKNLAEMEYYRVHAFDYLNENHELGGFQKKMMRLLYIPDEQKKRFSEVFETGKIAVVSGKINNQFNKSSETDTRLVKWNNEYLEIISDVDEVIEPGEIGKLLGGGITQKEAYLFRQEGLSILRYGINRENYRIGPSVRNENEFIIIYRKPTQQKWRTISRHPDMETAKLALDKLIKYLLRLSCESEGFHLVEHVLLRPSLDTDAFGFRFCINKDQAGLKNHSWTNFSLREEIIDELVNSADESTDTQKEPVTLNPNYKDNVLVQQAKRLKEDLNAYLDNRTETYPRFEMLVRNSSGKILHEEFYNMHVTVVLPSWPARFQDPEFRSFVESLFNSSAPAYLYIHFLWLGIEKMKEFEASYFPWLNALKSGSDLVEASEKLGRLLGADEYVIKHY